jgi:alkylation response protein AidB-like acyl-CoA dehydrogenase
MKSYVTRDGDDYILNGQKTFITNGPDADVVVVYAKLDAGDGADKRDRKVLTFVLDRGMEGFVQSKPFRRWGSQLAHRRIVLQQRATGPRPPAGRDRRGPSRLRQ